MAATPEYIVITCPSCSFHFIFIHEPRQKTTECASCKERFDLAGLRSFYRGPDLMEARHALAALSGRKMTDDQRAELVEATLVSRKNKSGPSLSGEKKHCTAALRNLLKKGPIAHEKIISEMSELGYREEMVEECLKGFLESDVAFEPRPGTYKLID